MIGKELSDALDYGIALARDNERDRIAIWIAESSEDIRRITDWPVWRGWIWANLHPARFGAAVERGKLVAALSYYRDQASRAEDDMAQESTLSPSRVMGGSGGPSGGKIPAILMATPAILKTARIERDLGSLRELTWRVCVCDWSLTRWAVETSGGRERYDAGKLVAIVPLDPRAVARARLQLRYAACTIVL